MHRLRPTFYQADPAGVLFYGRVFELFHQAFAAFIVAAGVPYETHFAIRDYAMPVVHAEADYRRPIRPGEELDVRVTLRRLGESSIGLGYEIVDAAGEVRATGTEVHVAVDAATFRKRPLPDVIRDAMAKFAPRPSRPGDNA